MRRRQPLTCPDCNQCLRTFSIEDAAYHLAFHEQVKSWPKSIASQDKKPGLGDLNESRNETARNHVGWRSH